MEKLFRACMTGLMYVMLEQDWEKESLREKRQFGGRDYREIYYWVQTNFLLTMYNRSSYLISIRVSALVCLINVG